MRGLLCCCAEGWLKGFGLVEGLADFQAVVEASSESAARLKPSIPQAMVAGLWPQLASIFRRSSLTDPGGAE